MDLSNAGKNLKGGGSGGLGLSYYRYYKSANVEATEIVSNWWNAIQAS